MAPATLLRWLSFILGSHFFRLVRRKPMLSWNSIPMISP